MANGQSNLPTGRLIGLAAVAGVLAGALGVYVMGGPSGNNEQAPATAAVDPAAAAACEAKTEKVALLDPLITGEVAAMLPADPPRLVGDLAFNDPQGTRMQLSDIGKVTLVNLWATWCAPCREEMPALNELQDEMGGETFEVVAVNVDTGDDEKPTAFLDEIGVASLGYYRDNTLGIFNELRRRNLALGLPVTLLVDADGCLLGHMNGPAEWASEDAKALIEAAI
ncbi:redoxin family protein [Aliihoeflea aestuarii]|jgi:thiol-disulfide isomerase/thioredoxin|uniref:thiol:disulfide interchange protein TlpA n=1 Tax=Aliihoeflea aestuarii TaxID=453840 RepID=UPI002094B433|nr:TlpA disulfide reductase family protein [Aliihoeflea aestuarii]MCO6392633.1 redoxin family protein [Aliihoeflea aestuarii]